ncbi:tape measure domain-containing protein [Phascolarctobacterium succinatutens CAG:287]|uniref:Tape measure domain-containing protein n=1 Tax=Phascolarctobacterium succinatutens CAG:287 TaxID=1263101 RepID=R6WQ18_9FIRM|nr:tape measure protein [Phascolarctobacterium succinatutens]CDD11460.1 tape measure domain-containing protein [Phascolarctobacterium succinatutens CAG:287]
MANKEISVKITADSKQAEQGFSRTAAAVEAAGDAADRMSAKMSKSTAILTDIAKMFQQLNSDVKAMRKSLDSIDSKNVRRVGDDLETVSKQSKKATSGIKGFADKCNKMSGALSAIAAVQLGSVFTGMAGGILNMGIASVQAAAQMRQYEIAFQTMLKSAEAGTQMLRDLQQFAAETPFDVPGVVSAGQQLMAFGFKAEEIIPMLTNLGDAASGLGLGTEGVSRLAYALGQMQTSGKLNAQDMMQLTSAGISAWDMLAQAAGKTVAEMKDLCSKGAIDSKAAVQTIVAGMNDQFGGMMAKTSDEVAGLLANIEETAGNTSAAVGKYLTEAFNIKGILKDVSDRLGEFQQKMQTATEQGKSLRDVIKECVPAPVIAAIGAFAAVLVVVSVAAVATLGAVLGLSAGIVAAGAAIGAAIALIITYWDDLANAVKAAVQGILDAVIIIGTAVTEAILGVVRWILDTIGDMWADITGDHNNWFNDFADMLGDAMDAVEDFARKAIAWFDKVFAAKQRATATESSADDGHGGAGGSYGDDSSAEKPEKRPATPKRPLIIPSRDTNVARTGGNGRNENFALKALQKENKINQERRKIENEYVRLKLKKEKDLFEAQNAIAKKYGTDAQKYQIQLKEIEFNKKQELQEEELAYTEQMLAAENALKEAQLRGASQKELDILKEKLALLKKTHQYTIDNINQSAAVNTESAKFDYSNKQISWKADYNASDAVGKMTMKNDKWKEEATESVTNSPFLDDKLKLEALTAINQKYDEQQQKINTISKIQQTSNQLAKDFSGAITDWITGAKSFGDAMKSVLQQLISQLIQAALYATIVAACTGGGGGFAARWKGAFGKVFASGGSVAGPGTGTSDSVPAMLSNGEYVLNAQAVDRLGVPFLNGLNTGRLRGFASGGLVGSGGAYNRPASVGSSSSSTSNSITLNVSALDASSFADFLARGGMQVLKQATLDDNRNFNAAFDTF